MLANSAWSAGLLIRKYHPGEEVALRRLFYETVHAVNRRDYSAEQLQAWAPREWDEQQWIERMQRNNPYVCVHENELVGFADVQSSGYIDQFYVHHEWQGRGVGKRLFATLEGDAREFGCAEMASNVSLTARPFFAARGFQEVAAQEVRLGTVTLKNFRMKKPLTS